MSVAVAISNAATLGDLVSRSLDAACAGAAVCLWCGSVSVTVARGQGWGGEVSVFCHECGSELSGPLPPARVESA